MISDDFDIPERTHSSPCYKCGGDHKDWLCNREEVTNMSWIKDYPEEHQETFEQLLVEKGYIDAEVLEDEEYDFYRAEEEFGIEVASDLSAEAEQLMLERRMGD